jgi:hypothetical protein
MRKGTWLVTVVSIVAGAALLALVPDAVSAGETTMQFKSGWFTWDETIDGASFVKEKGMLYGVGITRKDPVSRVYLAEGVEVWGGNLDYDGHDITGTKALKTDTSYIGTREELTLSVKVPAAAVTIEPFGGVGHKFWVRTRSSEDWNTFYGRGGVGGEAHFDGMTVFARAGAILPFYTRNHVSLSGSGLADVVVEPKSRLSAFAEGGFRFGSLSVSIEYEGMEFGQSARVRTHSLSSSGTGAVVVGTEAYQPQSSSSFVALRVGYSF